jgi:hypothetical protein
MIVQKTILLVLRSGGDFTFRDVELIVKHINGQWKLTVKPRIICLWDKASQSYNLGGVELFPLTNNWPKWWARMQLYSPEMEQYRPFLYIDLDTAVIGSLEKIFDLVEKYQDKYITLEDFGQPGQLATGLAWIPAKSKKVSKIWEAWQQSMPTNSRMDYFLRKVIVQDLFWQDITNAIHDFKPRRLSLLKDLPEGCILVCFHGTPRIFDAAKRINWVNKYVK